MSELPLGTLLSNLKSVALTVFVLLAFNSHDRTLHTYKHTHTHTHADKQTHIERTHYLRHSLRSLGGDNKSVNRDEGSYQLSHVYDKLFAAAATSSGERKSTTSFRIRQQLLAKHQQYFVVKFKGCFSVNSYTFIVCLSLFKE